jgi:hypothetical protein
MINKILILLIAIQFSIITLGGYLYSLIPLDTQVTSISSDICSYLSKNDTNSSSSNITIVNTTNETKIVYTKPSLSDSIFFVVTTVTTIGMFRSLELENIFVPYFCL